MPLKAHPQDSPFDRISVTRSRPTIPLSPKKTPFRFRILPCIVAR